MVVGVTVVCTVEPGFIIVVGVTGRVSIDVPEAYRIIAQKVKYYSADVFKQALTVHLVLSAKIEYTVL